MPKTKPKSKWRFAIGTTSLVPTEPGMHYLIADVDGHNLSTTIIHFIIWSGVRSFHVQHTNSGWHIYTDQRYTWRRLLRILSVTPGVDQKWVAIGRQRGYLFLADKGAVMLNWPVKRMVLHYGKTQVNPR